MSFFRIVPVTIKKDVMELRPEFIIGESNDLMIRGGAFYAVWNEKLGLWSRNEYDVVDIVDEALWEEYEKYKNGDNAVRIASMKNFSSKSWTNYYAYVTHSPDNYHPLDNKLTFASTKTVREDYASKRLPYDLSSGDCPAWDELISTLYAPLERRKIEWTIGAIVSGEAKNIQKFLVLYGDAGTGKSTILNIIQKMFDGYYCTFDSKALGSASNQFSLEPFKNNPLVAIQHDGDLSKIDDNSKLNSIVAHEEIIINEKRKSMYTMRMNPFLIMATNKPVKITDAKSGLIRRLIDVNPTGELIRPDRYQELMDQIDFEIGSIAQHCLDVYRKCGMHYYDRYRSTEMRYKTDVFYNFVDENYFVFKTQDGITLKQAYALYKEYCQDTSLSYAMPMYAFREELKNYFKHFDVRITIDGVSYRSYYHGFLAEKFEMYREATDLSEENDVVDENNQDNILTLESTTSLFDEVCSDCLAQYATPEGYPYRKWSDVTTKLSDIDTTKVHYVRIPENHIVIDFDIRDPNTGEKSAELNLKAASEFPPTYAEFSKSGAGIHLHYIYDGDSSRLSRLYSDGIEIKVFSGNSSLRRKLSLCNDIPISHISGGLPLKEKKVTSTKHIKNEKSLRDLIKRNLRKEIHPATKPSIDFIYKILDDAYNSGLSYDVSDLEAPILAFAANSTNQAPYCIKTVEQMRFKSKDFDNQGESTYDRTNMGSLKRHREIDTNSKPLVFFDIEVFPNLLLINYKEDGEGKPMHRMINPEPSEIEKLFDMRLVGYNNRRYDNHIIYARWLGKSIEEIYQMSKAIISGTKAEQHAAMYGEAYNLSYSDIYDFSSAPNKMSLKKAEIEMGIHHAELGMDWDKPVPESKWDQVSAYCDNDVIATEARFHYLAADWVAREILSDLAGMTVNDTTNTLTTRFIFGANRHPQNEFCYRDLSKPVKPEDIDKDVYDFLVESKPDMMAQKFVSPIDKTESILPYFPGYEFKWVKKTTAGKTISVPLSTYRDEEIGEGGYVYSEPGIYYNVALLDITSMHPNSSIDECIFGPRYTRILKELIQARVEIKHENWDVVRTLLGGKLNKYVDKVISGEITSKDLANALKTAINSIYGLTSAKFPNAFKDSRNVDNIVAKRGALFMVDLKHAVQEQGYTVAHIKTDSIKIPNADPYIINFVMEFGKKYGYDFEHEATYDRMCLVNKSVYIAKYANNEPHKFRLSTGEVINTPWTATGTQFQQPYVFKTLFAKTPVAFEDMCETKNVKTALYLDMNEGYALHSYTEEEYENAIEGVVKDALNRNEYNIKTDSDPNRRREEIINDVKKKYKGPSVGDLVETHNYVFVGRAGQFCPVVKDSGGGVLVREQNGKYVSATDADGYRWLESEMVRDLKMRDSIDLNYYRNKVDEAIESISKYGDFDQFVNGEYPDKIEIP